MARQDFLSNFRVARNLFVHPRLDGSGPNLDPQTTAERLARAAIWLTPKSVAGFNAADFPELGFDRKKALEDAKGNQNAPTVVAAKAAADSARQALITAEATAKTAYDRILSSIKPLYDRTVDHYQQLDRGTLGVATPDPKLDEAFRCDPRIARFVRIAT